MLLAGAALVMLIQMMAPAPSRKRRKKRSRFAQGPSFISRLLDFTWGSKSSIWFC